MAIDRLADDDYRRLLFLRTGLRRFLRWSEEQARDVGLTPAQHQLLLAVRGHEGTLGPTIGHVADALFLKHHSAVELVQRAEAAGLLTRVPDAVDGRVVRLALTRRAKVALEQLSALHLEELYRLDDRFQTLWEGLELAGPVSSARP